MGSSDYFGLTSALGLGGAAASSAAVMGSSVQGMGMVQGYSYP